jgi:hypothetical protein
VGSQAATALHAASLMWLVWVLFVRLRRHSTILLAPRSGFNGFWLRKKDDLIVAAVSSVLGAILGVAGTLLSIHYVGK